MALCRFLFRVFIAVFFFQNVNGQLNNLANSQKVGQNVNQVLPNNTPPRSVNDNSLQNDFSKSANINTSPQQTFYQTPQNLQSLLSLQSQNIPLNLQGNLQQSLQQSLPQSIPHSISQSLPQAILQYLNQQPNLKDFQQQPISYQPSNVAQSSFLEQPIFQDISKAYMPLVQQGSLQSINQRPLNGNINFQIPLSSLLQQMPALAQYLPLENSFASTYPSTATAPNCGCQRTDLISNLNNYSRNTATVPLPITDSQILPSYPSLPYQTVFSTQNPSVFGNNFINPYQNQGFELVQSPLQIQNDFALEEETFEPDNLTSLLMSLLQNPNKSSGYNQYSHTPYGPYHPSRKSKSSSLKVLLPVILSLIKDRRETAECYNERKMGNGINVRKDLEPLMNGGYSNKRDYSFRDEMYRDQDSEEETHRFAREHKNVKKLISAHNIDSNENDYGGFSEEQDD